MDAAWDDARAEMGGRWVKLGELTRRQLTLLRDWLEGRFDMDSQPGAVRMLGDDISLAIREVDGSNLNDRLKRAFVGALDEADAELDRRVEQRAALLRVEWARDDDDDDDTHPCRAVQTGLFG